MSWIVIETLGGASVASIVMNEDGTNKVFETETDARIEAEDCQKAVIIEI